MRSNGKEGGTAPQQQHCDSNFNIIMTVDMEGAWGKRNWEADWWGKAQDFWKQIHLLRIYTTFD